MRRTELCNLLGRPVASSPYRRYALACLVLGLTLGVRVAAAEDAASAGDTQVIQGVVEDVSGGDIVVRNGSGRFRIGVFPSQVTVERPARALREVPPRGPAGRLLRGGSWPPIASRKRASPA